MNFFGVFNKMGLRNHKPFGARVRCREIGIRRRNPASSPRQPRTADGRRPPNGYRRPAKGNQGSERGSVLVIVMLVAFGMVSIALYFAHSMSFELRASDNRASGLATGQAIEGAARYVAYILANYATNGVMPTNDEFECAAVPVGNAHFWIIGRDPSGAPSSEPYFGLIDEASKLNLNTADTNVLSYLPDMTTDFAEAIADWRDTNGLGLYSMNYAPLGYQDKNAPFETVDELRLVYGATMDLLVGDDLNRNGVLDANEQDLNGTGQVDSGLFDYTTVYSREPNFHHDGSSLTNVNDPAELRPLLEARLDSRASQILNQLQARGGGPGGGTTYSNLLQFYLASGMNSTEFGEIIDDVTCATNVAYYYGRVNINTAGVPVLTALFMGLGMDQSTAQTAAQQMITYREQNPDNLASIAWIVDALGNTSPVVQALARGDYITTRSFQFTADIAAVGPYGRGYRRVKFIFDTSDGAPKIIYRQDLSRLGWALGEKVRETWVAKTGGLTTE
ncbi:MAG: general secretion pathway protein GspK [Verrucomicrobiota bacterium]|nr:general secretion pathway protein GspK [Verrucomicrobiota bacterium]